MSEVKTMSIELTEKAVTIAARAIYEEGPSIGGDTEDGWAAQSEGYKHKARAVAHVVIHALSSQPQKG